MDKSRDSGNVNFQTSSGYGVHQKHMLAGSRQAIQSFKEVQMRGRQVDVKGCEGQDRPLVAHHMWAWGAVWSARGGGIQGACDSEQLPGSIGIVGENAGHQL